MTDLITVLKKEGYVAYTSKGVSMLPLLRQNKDVVIIKAKTDGFKKGEAVLFIRDNGQYVLHRILKITDGGYFIIGDNCVNKEFVRKEQILGTLQTVKRGKKTVSADDFSYKIYIFYVGIRRFFLKIRKKLGKIYRGIKS